MTNDLIAQARRKYLVAHPPRMNTVDSISGTATMTIPNIGDIQIIGCKLSMEYLAICHDEEAVEEWIQTALGIVKDPEMAGILFANVFRGFNTVIAAMTDRPGMREHFQRQAVDAWQRDFSEESE